ncbi:ribonuclease H-like domain-containing protein [Tanacetum coccineum]
MAVEGGNPPPPLPSTTNADKLIPLIISTKVPIKLDLEKHNYNSWSSFFIIHLDSLGLKPHVKQDTSSTNPEWLKLDDLNKMWILGSLCDSLQEQVVTTSSNSKALCGHLKDIFHDNKDSRATNLDNELRSIKIGKMSVNEYCTKIKSMADRLKNLGCVVSEKNLVIYTINGLGSRFATLESSFQDQVDAPTTFESSSSSPTILMAATTPDAKGDLYPVTKSSSSPAAFVSTSSTTWHQRLGHPGDEVLHSLTSRHFISCNKENSTHVCHACQLGKHVKLPIHSSNSSVTKCFDIIHSDMWTSPIHKFHADGTLSRYKARLVANGSSQQLSVDFDETFSPVVKSTTIFTVLSLVVSRQWPIHQLDVKNAFLNGDLSEMVAYLPIYVDEIILTASSQTLLQQIIDSLQKEFDMTDLGALNYFLGISTVHHSTGLFLSQEKYVLQLLERAHMVDCNPSRTPVDSDAKLGPDGVPIQDPTLYCSLAGGYSISPLLAQIYLMSSSRSTLGYCVFLGDNLLSWSSKRQHTISHSSAKAEYRGVTNIVAKTAWIRNLLHELHSPLLTATLVYCDNVSAVYMSANPVQHQRTKHIEIDIHFVCDMVTTGHVRVHHVSSRFSMSISSPRVFY